MGQRIKRLNIELGPFEVLSSSLRDLFYERKNIPLYQCAEKKLPFFGPVGHTPGPPPPFPALCPLWPSWPSGYHPRLTTQRSWVRTPAPTFFSFFGSPRASPRPSQGFPKALQGLLMSFFHRFVHCKSSSQGVEHGSAQTWADPCSIPGCCSRSGQCVDPLSHERVALKLKVKTTYNFIID